MHATSTLSINGEIQTLTLVANGATTLSFSGVNATSALTVTTGTSGTTAAQVQANLQTIPALATAGNVTVSGNTGGPFTIVFGNTLAGQNVSQIASSSTANATTAKTIDG